MSMHAFLWAEDSETALRAELGETFPDAPARVARDSLIEAEFDLESGRRLPQLIFARQMLPNARWLYAESIRGWAGVLFEAINRCLPEDAPWSLHVEPHYGVRTGRRIGARAWHSATRSGAGHEKEPAWSDSAMDPDAGRHRCQLIRAALIEILRKKRRHLLRQLRDAPAPFGACDSHVQLLLTSAESGLISEARAPLPFEQRHLISPFPKGEVPPGSDKCAPSRAFSKLVEAELRFGRAIRAGDTCVDLGAAPGSWTYVAANRGARVIAVDRSELREDLLANRSVRFVPGDAFRFTPEQPVDWLLCDVIAAPERTTALLLEWLRNGWCQYFVVTIKLGDDSGTEVVATLKRDLPPLTRELFLTRLCANKKEICSFGISGHSPPRNEA